jgi:inner membrane protein involved in colicin E2 resistance
VNSKNKIRESQILASNEQIRQTEIAEAKRKEEKERKQRLQLLFIGMFIPALFLFTLLVSRIRLHIRAIKLMGILSLLFFFEYLTLLLHPLVASLTNHIPILEILIFVGIAAILIPLHHKAEHWLIHKLLFRHVNPEEKKIQ